MSDTKTALLTDRAVVAVSGEDAGRLLQGIVTNDIDHIEAGRGLFAGLLSPQGKVLFDFFAVTAADGYLLDVAADKASELAKRLTMYKLRAKATIEVAGDRFVVGAGWGERPEDLVEDLADDLAGGIVYRDPRADALGWRFIAPRGHLQQGQPASDYHAHRIALGIPEGEKDYDFGDAFPHEANFDLLRGVSFEKGCYVGQEIVARMQHRGTVRKRVVRVTGASPLPVSRPDVKVGEVVIGRLGSVADAAGLAMLRLDRAIEAIDKGEAITANGLALTIDTVMIERQRKLMVDKVVAP